MGGRAGLQAAAIRTMLAGAGLGLLGYAMLGTETPRAPQELELHDAGAGDQAPAAVRPDPAPGPRLEPAPAPQRIEVPSPERVPGTAGDAAQIQARIADLRDDHVRGNAEQALRELAAAGAAAVPALEQALDSPDHQQHAYAARALHWIGGTPSDRLLRDAADELALGRGVAKPEELLATLIAGGSRAAPHLRRHVATANYWRQFCVAYALARCGDQTHAHWNAHLMLRHLGHNDVERDAMMAAQALYHLGEPVVPILEHARPWLDDQGRTMVDLVLLDLREPPRTRADYDRRQRMQQRLRVSYVYADPVLQFDFRRSLAPVRTRPR